MFASADRLTFYLKNSTLFSRKVSKFVGFLVLLFKEFCRFSVASVLIIKWYLRFLSAIFSKIFCIKKRHPTAFCALAIFKITILQRMRSMILAAWTNLYLGWTLQKFPFKFWKPSYLLFESPYLCEKNEGSFIKIGKVLPKLFHFQTTKKPPFQGIASLPSATKKWPLDSTENGGWILAFPVAGHEEFCWRGLKIGPMTVKLWLVANELEMIPKNKFYHWKAKTFSFQKIYGASIKKSEIMSKIAISSIFPNSRRPVDFQK